MTSRPLSREEAIAGLTGGVLDVLVVGGGIVGSGVARDAAMRGLTVGAIDRFDFAFGTSSRSSRLLHGGLRYLAQGRIGLVREASVEKMTIHRIAPHLAAPLPFIFPTRKGTEWKLWKLRIGVKIYDLLCSGRNLGRSSSMGREEALRALPALNPEGLTGAVKYFDGFTNDARLVLDTLRSAAGSGAHVCNYMELQSARRDGDIWQCKLFDHEAGAEFNLKCRVIVNATGAWANRFPDSGVSLRLTKGVHLVIDRKRLPIEQAVVMTEGSRILFAIPWSQRIILGTTDTDYAGPIESPECDQKDLRYILDVANNTFPSVGLTSADVVSTWAGLRPLIADPKGKPSDISRAHEIIATEPGWIDVAGGKLTTYRLMAEQTVDRIVRNINAKCKECETATTPLLAGTPEFSGIEPPAVSEQAVEHYCRNEWARRLDDVMIRRTSWRHYHRNHLEIARRVANGMANTLGWSAQRIAEELEHYTAGAIQPCTDAVK